MNEFEQYLVIVSQSEYEDWSTMYDHGHFGGHYGNTLDEIVEKFEEDGFTKKEIHRLLGNGQIKDELLLYGYLITTENREEYLLHYS